MNLLLTSRRVYTSDRVMAPPPRNSDPSAAPQTFRSLAAQWLFQQGVSTVLLGFIAIGAWYGIPAAVHELRIVLDTTAQRHQTEVKALSDAFERTLDRLQGKLPKEDGPPKIDFNLWPEVSPAPAEL